jgi:hypothetical protein
VPEPTRRIVLIPRYTSLVGTQPFYTPPLSVRAFQSVQLDAWRSRGLGATPPTYALRVQQSTDMDSWHDLGTSIDLDADEEAVERLDFDLEWIRLVVQLAGTYPALSTFAVGDFEPREGV